MAAAGGGFVKDFKVFMSSFVILSRASAAAASKGSTLSSSFWQSMRITFASSLLTLQSFSSYSHIVFFASASFYFFCSTMSIWEFSIVAFSNFGCKSSSTFYIFVTSPSVTTILSTPASYRPIIISIVPYLSFFSRLKVDSSSR
jgi:hypothetical protein